MEHQENHTTSISELIEAIWRHKLKLLISVAVVVVPVLLYNHYATPVYEATSSVAFENYGKNSIVGFEVASTLSRTSILANHIQEIHTSSFARQVYKALPDSVRTLFGNPDPIPPQFDLEGYIVGMINKNLSANPLAETDFVSITFASGQPSLSATVANTAAKVLQENNLEIHRQEYANLKKFIESQIGVVSEKLRNAEDTLSNYKQDESISSIDEESREILQRVTQLEVLLNRVSATLYATQQKHATINKQLDSQKQNLSKDVVRISDPLTIKLKEKLVDLNIQYSDLHAQGLAEDHPKLAELRREMEQARQKLVQTTMDILEDGTLQGMIDPISQLKENLEESIRLEVEVQSLRAQKKNLQETLKSYNERIKALPGLERDLARLLRDREINNKIYVQLLEEREQARIREASEIGNIRLVESASIPAVPTRPRKMLNLLIGMFAGTVIGLVWILAREFMRDVPRTGEDVESVLKLPVLASIPYIKPGLRFQTNGKHRQKYLINDKAASPLLRDAFSFLWSAVEFALPKHPSVVMITSALPGEGKSTVAANLAIIAAQHGKKTILIDGDIRKPVIHQTFDMPIFPGLSNLVNDMNNLSPKHSDEVVQQIAGLQDTNGSDDFPQTAESLTYQIVELFRPLQDSMQELHSLEKLRILTSGNSIEASDMVWSSKIIPEVIWKLKKAADLIVIDAPPALGVPDASYIARHCDFVLLCVETARTEKELLQRVQKIFANIGVRFLGVVLNKVEPESIYGGYKNYKYYTKQYKNSSSNARFEPSYGFE